MLVEVVGGASTTSRRPERMQTPLKSQCASGCEVCLSDGRKMVDWQMGLHGALFGYTSHAYDNAPTSIVSYKEQIIADILGSFYPDIEAVRFMCNGSDACAASIKLARAVTGRDKILSFGYHGTASCFATPPESNARTNLPAIDMRRGTLKAERDALIPLRWLGELARKPIGECAAIIIECPPTARHYESKYWLKILATEAKEHGTLFILDEVVTGFRYGPNGAAGYYDLEGLVDLYCFGKTLGNGFPIAALAGRRDIMRELTNGVHFSGTFFGAPVGLEAALVTLQRLRSEPPWEHIYDIGEYLSKEWNAAMPYKLVGHPTRPIIDDETLDDQFVSLRRHLFNRGHIVVDHPWYITTAHQREHVDDLVKAAREWK